MNFQYAKPIWAKGLSTTKNVTCLFTAEIPAHEKSFLRITASSFYRVFLDGKLSCYGPARAPKGFARVDEYVFEKANKARVIAIEVAGYYCKSFYALEQPSFLQAELICKEKVIATGEKGGFSCRVLDERIRKGPRFSFQRGFSECYRFEENPATMYATNMAFSVKTEEIEPYLLLDRKVAYPIFEERNLAAVEQGKWSYNSEKEVWDDRIFWKDCIGIYPTDKLTYNPNITASKLEYYLPNKKCNDIFSESEYVVFELNTVNTGFLGISAVAEEDSHIYLVFDETDNRVNPKEGEPIRIDYNRNCTLAVISCEIKKGKFDFLSFEPYCAKYVKVVVLKGKLRVGRVYMTSYENPMAKERFSFSCEDEKIQRVIEAARRTFEQNAVDILTDCPGRERAGWLCDSYFSARAEQLFTGENIVEKNFLENYLLRPYSRTLPAQMIGMCYPADFVDGDFISNWAMWYIVELHDYYRRTGDVTLIKGSKDIVYGLFSYFSQFYNEVGLLENVPRQLVSWCRGNGRDFLKGVNFPTNMLYALSMRLAGEMYSDNKLLKNSEKLQEKIRQYAFNGEFFEDNLIRKRGKLIRTKNTSETCLCYAFFCGTATAEKYSDLWEKFLYVFGPKRDDSLVYPKVYKTAAFIGYYLRLIVLDRAGLSSQALSECKEYFYKMAVRTGTLWEHDNLTASLNHGFASYAANIIVEGVSGFVGFSKKDKTIFMRKGNANVKFKARIPIGKEYLLAENDGSGVSIIPPKGYTIKYGDEKI